MQGVAIGRIVHYVLSEGDVPLKPSAAGQEVPAIIVRDWQSDNGCVNLQVFVDGANHTCDPNNGILWLTSRTFSEKPEPGHWHWPERS